MAEQAPTIESTRRRARPETSAWLILVTFFLIFCAIVAGAGLVGWGYYTGAMERVEGGLVRVHVPRGRDLSGARERQEADAGCSVRR